MTKTDPFIGMFTLKRVTGLSSEELRECHRIALKIHEVHPDADITGILDAVVFNVPIDYTEEKMLSWALAGLAREPLGYRAAHPINSHS